MKRPLFTITTAISLVTCLLASMLGLRSYWTGARINLTAVDRYFNCVVWHGRVSVAITLASPQPVALPDPWKGDRLYGGSHTDPPPRWRTHINLEYEPTSGNYGILEAWALEESDWYWSAPWWPICPVTAAAPAVWLCCHLRRWRGTCTNACPTCGYDLRATPLRCPECGNETKVRSDNGTFTELMPSSSAQRLG